MEKVSRKDAIAQGMSRYFTGITCKHGHVCEKYCKNYVCVECKNIHTSKWMKNNKGAAKNASKKWRSSNKELIRLRYAEWYEKNKDYHIKWKVENRDKVCAATSKYRKSSPDKVLATNRNRRARIAMVDGKHSAKDVANILYMQGGLCVYCEKDISNEYHVDHIMPLALGGSNWPSNLQCLCPTCNVRKQAIHPDEFMKRTEK